jgi:hypothetical protein
MLAAVTRALAARASLGIVGVATAPQAAAAIAALGLVLWFDADLEGGVYGLLYRGVVAVKKGLLPGTVLVVLAHELGHALCGHADGLYRPATLAGGPADSPEEEVAQIAAYVFLVGAPAPDVDALSAQVQHAHDRGGVPWDFLCSVESILTDRGPFGSDPALLGGC